MKKALKIFGIIILLLIIAIALLPVIFKGKIVEVVKEETNAMLNAKVDFGEFDLGLISTFPNFNFSINDVKVQGVDKFDGVSLAEVKNLSLKVDLMSVISGDEINIKSIVITEPIVKAIVLADTTANWDIMKETEEEEVVEEESTSSFNLGLKDVTITNGYILYKDETMDLYTEIIGLNFNMSGDMTADVTTLSSHSTIDTFNLGMEGVNYMKNAVIVADADIEADLLNSKYTFKENEVKVNELVLGMDGWLAMLEEDIDMELTFGAKQTEFKNILSMVPAVYMTDFANVKTAGKLALDGHAKGTYSETKLPAFGLNLVVNDAMFKYPDLPKSVKNIQVDLHVNNPDGELDNTIVDLKTFHMELAGNPIDANLFVKTPISDADIKAGLKANFNLASLKDVMPLEGEDELNGQISSDLNIAGKVSALEQERYEDFHAEGNFGITNMNYKSDSLPYQVLINTLAMNFSPAHVELSDFDSKIGKTDIQATGRIDNIISYVFSDDEELTGTFNVTSTLLDVNEFMEEEDEATVDGESGDTEEEPLEVVEVPKNINFTLNSSFAKVIYDKLEILDMKGVLVIKDQKIDMQHLGMNMLDGSMVMDGYYETTNPKQPGIDFDMNIQNFDVEMVASSFEAVTEMAPITKNCTGKFSTTMKINGVLNDKMEPDLNTLNGGGTMKTQNIEVVDFKPMVKLANVLKNDKLKKIDLGNTNIKYEIRDGRVYTEPFDVKMGNTTGTMSGSNGLDQTIDYTMALKIPSKELGAGDAVNKLSSQASQLGMDLKTSETVNVDVKIGGTFTDPTISTGLKDLAGNVVEDVKEQVKEKINEEVDKAKEKALEEARKAADKVRDEGKKAANKVRAEGKKAANQVRDKANKEAQKLIDDAGGNFLKKKAAEVAAKQVRDAGEKQAKKVEAEANKKAKGIEDKANAKADKMVEDAAAKLNK